MATGDAEPSSLDKLLKLVDDHCTKDQIYVLLGAAKEANPTEFVVNMGDKKEVLLGHLRKAHDLGLVPVEAMADVLTEAEDSENQLVYFYKPATGTTFALCKNGETVAVELFGENWRETKGFPLFHLNPTGMEWANFQVTPNGWVGKIYAGVHRYKPLGTTFDEKTQVESTQRLRYTDREVWVVRYADGVLEFRLPPSDSKSDLNDSLDGLWGMLQDSITPDDFVRLDLQPVLRRMVQTATSPEGTTLYAFYTMDMENGDQVTARIGARTPKEKLPTNGLMQSAVEHFDKCRNLGVLWALVPELHGMDGNLITIIGKHGNNTIHIRSKSTSKAVRYVTEQLRGIARTLSTPQEGVPET